jgi:hypothetical protein
MPTTTSTRRRLVTIAAASLLAAVAAVAGVVAALPAAAAPVLCEKFAATTIQNGQYIVMNNVWGANTAQCIDVNQSGGFTVTTANHNNATNGAPAAYPAIYAGCHYANCTTGSTLPRQASSSGFADISTSVNMSYPSSGTWNAAYDIWMDPTARTDGQNTGIEIMIWLNRQGSIQPIGSRVGTANLLGATWDVWFGNPGWNVASYVRQTPTTSLSFTVDTFVTDAINRGYAQRSWYLTSVQAGFEPWIGGAGLTVNSFTYSTSGTPGDTQAPSAPSNLAASNVGSNSAQLSWNASTDNVGVTGYDVFRAPGTSGGTFTQVGTASGTTFNATGLSASSTYRFFVRARDAAGNTSGNSNSAAYRVVNSWPGAFQAEVVVTNTGSAALTGWTVTLTFSTGLTITQMWSGSYTQSGNTVTIRNVDYNGNLGPNASTSLGFIANVSGSTGATAAATCA